MTHNADDSHEDRERPPDIETRTTRPAGITVAKKSDFAIRPQTVGYRKLAGCVKAFSTLGLVGILVMYNFLGAVIFMSLDGAYGQGVYGGDNVTSLRINFMKSVSSREVNEFTNHTKFKIVMHRYLLKFERKVYDYHKHHKLANLDRSLVGFWGALFFSGTVVTTIGRPLRHSSHHYR